MTELTFQERLQNDLDKIRNWENGKINHLRLGMGVKTDGVVTLEKIVLVELENNKMLVKFYSTDSYKLTDTITLTKQPAIYISTYEDAERKHEGGDKLILRITGTSNLRIRRGKSFKKNVEFTLDEYMKTALKAMKNKAKKIGLKEDLIDERGLKNDYADGEYLYRDSQPVSGLVVVDTKRNEVVSGEGGSKRRTRKHGRKHKKQTHKKSSRKNKTRRQKRRTGRKLAKKSRKHRRRH